MLSGCTEPLDSNEAKLGSSNQEVFPSAVKNTWLVSVSCHAWKCVLIAIFWCLDFSEVPMCHLFCDRWVFSNFHKDSGTDVSWTHSLLFWLSKGCKPDFNHRTL